MENERILNIVVKKIQLFLDKGVYCLLILTVDTHFRVRTQIKDNLKALFY